jgi:hypothetical protein
MPKYQYKVTLADGEVIRSISDVMTEKEQASALEILEYAAKDSINYFKFQRDTGGIIVISKEALRTARYFELVEVK